MLPREGNVGMDRKSRRSVAVTAGLAAVLALSPVVAPAVTVLAQDGASAQSAGTQTETYTVTYVYNGGTDKDGLAGSKEVTYKSGQKLNVNNSNPQKLSRDGYTFAGWYTESGEKVSVMSYVVTADITLTARWFDNPTITFYNEISYEDINEADPWKVDEAPYDKRYEKPDDPSLPSDADSDDYIFDGWYTDPSLDEQYKFSGWNSGFTEDTTLYAKWTKFPTVTYYLSPDSSEACYEVVVDLNAGPDDRKKPLLKSAVTEHLGDTIPEGYTIEGFYTDPEYTNKFTDFAYVDEDTTLYIKFDKQPTVSYSLVYGDETLDSGTGQVNLFDYFDAPEVPEGYRIVRWVNADGQTFGIGETPIKGDMILTAECVKVYTVSFDLNAEGMSIDEQVVDENTKLAQPQVPEREGYDFAGWYTDEDCTQAYDFDVPVTGDMTLYAKWTPVVDPDPEPTPDPDPEPTPDPDPEPTPDPEPEPTPDPETKTFSVTLNDGLAGTEDQVITIAEGETIDSSAIKAPTYDGWTFVGWFTDSDLTQEWDFSTPVTSDMTLWAGWLRNDVDGSGVTDDTETTTDDVEKDANKAEKDNDPAVPDTGDATVAVSGIAAVGAALTGAGALIRRRR